MVSFICGACQETVKKNKVNKHVEKCRNCWVLSCIDCSKNFEGDAYNAHNSCISEAEKYQGALFRPKAGKSGKADPQARWMETIRRLADDKSQTQGVASVLSAIGDYDNVPRKKKQFTNFLNNSARIGDPALVERVFLAVLEAWTADKPGAQTAAKTPAPADAIATPAKEAEVEDADSLNKKRKRADVDEDKSDVAAVPEAKKSKSEYKALRKAVKKAIEDKDGKIKLKSLKKALAKQDVVVSIDELKQYVTGKGSSRFEIAEGGKTVSIKSK